MLNYTYHEYRNAVFMGQLLKVRDRFHKRYHQGNAFIHALDRVIRYVRFNVFFDFTIAAENVLVMLHQLPYRIQRVPYVFL